MQIAHLALWSQDIDKLKDFYIKYFGGTSNQKYVNAAKGFESYFISFEGGCALELMKRTDISFRPRQETLGYCHIAFKVGSHEKVIELTNTLAQDGYTVAGLPSVTGDGYFESVILDPDGNRVEIVA